MVAETALAVAKGRCDLLSDSLDCDSVILMAPDLGGARNAKFRCWLRRRPRCVGRLDCYPVYDVSLPGLVSSDDPLISQDAPDRGYGRHSAHESM